MTEQVKRLCYWAFNLSKYRQLRYDSRGRADMEELELDRPGDQTNYNSSSSNDSLKAKAFPYLPRRLACTIERKLQRNQDDQRGWVIGVLLCACGATLVLFLNVILTACAAAFSYSRFKGQTSTSAVLYEGNCPFTKHCARWLHFLINILSTLILAASNYCMQCLSSPSRKGVDTAHARRQWLDIGVPSLRNLKHVRGKRLILWRLLLISSLPIHMIYNSAVFNALGTNEYRVFVASADFDFNDTSNESPGYVDCLEQVTDRDISSFYSATRHFEHLNVQKCMDAYAMDYNTDRGTLVVVTKSAAITNESLLLVGAGSQRADYTSFPQAPYYWMCLDIPCSKANAKTVDGKWAVSARRISAPGLTATIPSSPPYTFNVSDTYDFPYDRIRGDERRDYERLASFMHTYPHERDLVRFLNNATGWRNSSWAKDVEIQRTGDFCTPEDTSDTIPDFPVDHCLSEKVKEKCQLQFSLPICLVVIACNCIKVICMFLTARDGRAEILLTLGDALSSFLSKPDTTTKGRCLVSKSDIKHQRFWGPPESTAHISQKAYLGHLPPRKSWMRAVSIRYLVSTLTFCLAIISVSGGLFAAGVKTLQNNGRPTSFGDLWELGFGTSTSATTIGSIKGQFMGMVFLANTPQLIVSTAYFLYNNLLTNMLLAAEYDGYAKQRKPLRVSWPKGLQRSTYYLSLPYQYSVPLLAASVLLHWLISQSLFFIGVMPVGIRGDSKPSAQISSLGFSPIAIIFAMILGGVMVAAILVLGMRRFKSNIPLAVSCSAAISAACHPLRGGEHALRPVMWGEIQIPRANQPSLSVSESRDVLCRPGSDGDESEPNQMQEGSGVNLLAERHSDDNVSAHCSFTSHEVVAPHRRRFYA